MSKQKGGDCMKLREIVSILLVWGFLSVVVVSEFVEIKSQNTEVQAETE